jgi:hypothetical protein
VGDSRRRNSFFSASISASTASIPALVLSNRVTVPIRIRVDAVLVFVAAFVLASTMAWGQHPIVGTPGACKAAGSACVPTYHNDNARDGVNPNETVLTPSTFATGNFGLLSGGTVTVDGLIYAQPLYLSAVAVSTPTCPAASGPYNLVLVATENNTVYAFTYTYTVGGTFQFTQCWSLSLNGTNQFGSEVAIPFTANPLYKGFPCSNNVPQTGVMSTPVVDTSVTPPVMYVVSAHQTPNGNNTYLYKYKMHALLLNNGAEATNSPYDMSAAFPAGINAANENQRPGLALAKGSAGTANIFTSFGSYCDLPPYSGYVAGLTFTYKTQTFAPISSSKWVFDTEAGQTDQDGGIWMGGAAPAVDAGGNVYVSVGNGNWDGDAVRASLFGESVVKIASNASFGLTPVDYYTPNDYNALNNGLDTVCSAYGPNSCPLGYSFNLGTGAGVGDLDLGSGGVTLISPVGVTNVCGSNQELVAGGKEGIIYAMCASKQTGSIPQTIMGGWDGCGYECDGLQPSNEANTACSQSSTPGNGAIAQCFQGVNAGENLGTVLASPGIHGATAFWPGSSLNYLYVAGAGTNSSPTPMVAYQMLSTGLFNTTAIPETIPATYSWPGTVPAISWNGSLSSTGILWTINASGFGKWSVNTQHVFFATPAKPAILTAYQALPQTVNGTTTLKELWHSSSLVSNYGPGGVKFVAPTIANGLVFVAGGVPGYAPGLPGSMNVNCTATFLVTSTTPACQGMLSVYGQLH